MGDVDPYQAPVDSNAEAKHDGYELEGDGKGCAEEGSGGGSAVRKEGHATSVEERWYKEQQDMQVYVSMYTQTHTRARACAHTHACTYVRHEEYVGGVAQRTAGREIMLCSVCVYVCYAHSRHTLTRFFLNMYEHVYM